jgi:hypothetical protein
MMTEQALALVRAELDRAKHNHQDFNSGHEGWAVIREELDELWSEVKTDKQYLSYGGPASYEAVQVAAMALRFLVDLCDYDGTVAYTNGRRRVGA